MPHAARGARRTPLAHDAVDDLSGRAGDAVDLPLLDVIVLVEDHLRGLRIEHAKDVCGAKGAWGQGDDGDDCCGASIVREDHLCELADSDRANKAWNQGDDGDDGDDCDTERRFVIRQ